MTSEYVRLRQRDIRNDLRISGYWRTRPARYLLWVEVLGFWWAFHLGDPGLRYSKLDPLVSCLRHLAGTGDKEARTWLNTILASVTDSILKL